MSRPRNSTRPTPITGPWLDIDEGVCPRCGDTRRLYVPVMLPALQRCASCAQASATSSIPTVGGVMVDEDEDAPTIH